jgi:putative transposase
LFQARYQAILIDKAAYWLQVNRFVVLDPVRAGMVPDPGSWPWSSYNATVGANSAPDLLIAAALLAQFGEQWNVARRRHQIFREDGIGQESLWSDLKRQIYLGDDRFVTRAQARLNGAAVEDVNKPCGWPAM